MPHYRATVTSTLAPQDAFAYMARFENVAEWDPGIRGVRVDPPGAAPAVGVAYVVTMAFGRGTHDIHYRVVELAAPTRIVLEGDAPRYRVRDVITVEPAGTGSRVTYAATVTPRGILRLASPLVQRAFTKAADAAIARLRPILNPEHRGATGT